MSVLVKIIVCFIAGAIAGTGISCSGISAAIVIAPLLAAFAGISPYQAIGIGLAADACAGAFSAWTYKKKNYVDTENTRHVLIFLVLGTVAGSIAASFLPERAMGSVSLIVLLLIGISFVLKKEKKQKKAGRTMNPRLLTFLICYFSFTIGLSCGFLGNGGGMIILLVLTLFMNYEMHRALGTSIYLMCFIALAGCVTHFVIAGIPDLLCLALSIVFTVFWAKMTAGIVNRVKSQTLNRVCGIVMIVCSVILLVFNFLK